MRSGKSLGLDLKSWLCNFLTLCMRQLKIPWRWVLIAAIHKPEKPLGNPKNYHPICLLCVPFKIIERLICARVEPIIDPLAYSRRNKQAFQHGKSTVNQVTLPTQDVEDAFPRRLDLCLLISQQPQLQATAIASWQAHGPHDHGAGWQSQDHPCLR